MHSGPSMMNAGPSMMNAGPPMMNAGPPMMNAGPPMMNAGPSMNPGPPMMGSGPPMMKNGPPMMNTGPPPPPSTSRVKDAEMPRPTFLESAPEEYRTNTLDQNGDHKKVPCVLKAHFGVDQGFSIPRYLRASVGVLACSNHLLTNSKLPMVASVSAFADRAPGEAAIPVCETGDMGPVRCHRCRG